MASRAKNKTTFAKLAREQKVRERRQLKKAKKDARKRAAEGDPLHTTELESPEFGAAAEPAGDQ